MTCLVVFRTDASSDIGSGHVMRCLTLAQSLRTIGAECVFVCREHFGHLCERIESRGFIVKRLPLPALQWHPQGSTLAHAVWLGATQQDDAADTLAVLAPLKLSPDWMIVDHYGIDAVWESCIRQALKAVMVIDDLADRVHDCDVLLDQNMVADLDRRYDALTPKHCLRLLGPHYALLQDAYTQMRRHPDEGSASRRILVYFGGADQRRLTTATVDALMKLDGPAFEVDVVIDRTSDQYEGLVQRVAGRPDITLHSNLPSLAPLLAAAGIAIGASGASSWERLYFGVPSIVVPIADNQRPIADELARRRYATVIDEQDLNGGDFGSIVEQAFAARREGRLATASALVDGKGSERNATSLCAHPDMPLSIRPADADDEAILLVWANDPETRRNAFNSDPISTKGHAAWFSRKLATLAICRIFMLETRTGLPIGQIRFDRVDLEWVIGYSLAPHMRGRKLGTRLIDDGLTAFRDAVGKSSVVGFVKIDNRPSRQAFLRCGFTETRVEEEDHVAFRKDV